MDVPVQVRTSEVDLVDWVPRALPVPYNGAMSEGPAKRAQFELSNLLMATALTGAGFGCLAIVLQKIRGPISISTFVLFLAIGPLICAGLLALKGRWRLGLYLGFFGQIVIWFGWAFAQFGWEGMWR